MQASVAQWVERFLGSWGFAKTPDKEEEVHGFNPRLRLKSPQLNVFSASFKKDMFILRLYFRG